MAEDTKTEEKREDSRVDAETCAKLDAISKHLDALHQRMDAYESRKDESKEEEKEEEKEEKEEARADSEKEKEMKEKEEREDAARKERARHDAQIASILESNKKLEEQLAALRAHVTDAPTEDRAKFAEVWNRGERLAQLHCDSQGAPKWAPGESLHAYSCRLFDRFKKFSTAWKDVDLTKVTEPSAFAIATTQIYSDAEAAALNPENVPTGELRMVTKKQPGGREIITWVARNDDACWKQFANLSVVVGKFNRPPRDRN